MLLIKNGIVYDPLNNINAEVMDIAIDNGIIVDKIKENRAKIIDASGLVVMPGGVDIHAHIAGSEVNSGRLLRPEDHFRDFEAKTKLTRSGVGYSIPSTFTTGYRYSRMGYTTVMNPSMPPLEARHTHEELNDTPIIDKATFPLLGDWWFLLDGIGDGSIKECAAFIAWIIKSIKGYAIKIVNPGGLEAWGFGKNVRSLDDPVPNFNVTPKQIITSLCNINKILNLPHTIHVHTNNLGIPGNYETTLETMKCVERFAINDKPVIHITHCQFSSYKGSDWSNVCSGADKIANYINMHNHVTIDIGQIDFVDTTTMTADGPFQYGLHCLSGNKWVNHDVETETSGGIVPFKYRKKSYVHATQWTIGLELALLIKNPWKVFLTTDHPNAAPFMHYPKIISWLVSKKAREEILKKINNRARKRSTIQSIDREYDLYEIAIITRSGTAKALGLKQKGHLGIGADADIAIYNIDPRKVSLSVDYKMLQKAFSETKYTIKNGEVVVKDGRIVKSSMGKTYWVDIGTSKEVRDMDIDIRNKFKDYLTVQYENYPLSENYLNSPSSVKVKAAL